jgi:uncharacterized protein YraI
MRILLTRGFDIPFFFNVQGSRGEWMIIALAIAVFLVLSIQNAKTTADGCAVVLKTPDGFLNVRKGPGIQYPTIAKANPGDFLYVDDRSACSQEKTSDCADNGKWIHVTGMPKRPLTLDGWVSLKFVEVSGDCSEQNSSENQECRGVWC